MTVSTIVQGLVLSAVMTLAGAASDVTGKWTAEFTTADGQTAKNVFTLQVEGEKLTGTVFSSFSGSEAKIEEGTIKGNVLSFAITRDFGGTEVRLRYSGHVAGDEIKFTVTAGEGTEGFQLEMTATRDKS